MRKTTLATLFAAGAMALAGAAQAATFDSPTQAGEASTMTHGAPAGDNPALAIGAGRLAQSIARDLFVADADAHWERLQALEEPELLPTKWYVPPQQRR
jgi:hypothetical protein